MNKEIDDMLEKFSSAIKSLQELETYLEGLIKIYTDGKLFYTDSSSDKNALSEYLTSVQNMISAISIKKDYLQNFNDNWLPKISTLQSKNLSKEFKISSFVGSTGYTKTEYRKILSVKFSSVSFEGAYLYVKFAVAEKKNKVETTKNNFVLNNSTTVRTTTIATSNRSTMFVFNNNDYNSFIECCNNDFSFNGHSVVLGSRPVAVFIL